MNKLTRLTQKATFCPFNLRLGEIQSFHHHQTPHFSWSKQSRQGCWALCRRHHHHHGHRHLKLYKAPQMSYNLCLYVQIPNLPLQSPFRAANLPLIGSFVGVWTSKPRLCDYSKSKLKQHPPVRERLICDLKMNKHMTKLVPVIWKLSVSLKRGEVDKGLCATLSETEIKKHMWWEQLSLRNSEIIDDL